MSMRCAPWLLIAVACARAAFFAAKAELGRAINAQKTDALPTPAMWFSQLKRFAGAKYYRGVLKECGHFRRWVSN